MPTIKSTYTIDISPEKYVNACSPEELQELSIFLCAPRFDWIYRNSDNSDKFQRIPAKSAADQHVSGNQLLESVTAGAGHKEVYDQCVKLFGDHPVEAIKLLGDIHQKSGIGFDNILPLMQDFKKLEAFRVKHLVNKPQEVTEEK